MRWVKGCYYSPLVSKPLPAAVWVKSLGRIHWNPTAASEVDECNLKFRIKKDDDHSFRKAAMTLRFGNEIASTAAALSGCIHSQIKNPLMRDRARSISPVYFGENYNSCPQMCLRFFYIYSVYSNPALETERVRARERQRLFHLRQRCFLPCAWREKT